jgi:hypothetical protein
MYSAAHATMRASDADRDRVAEVLREAYAEGRLDADEHTERISRAYEAKTLGELAPLLSDLPASFNPTASAAAPSEGGWRQPIAYGPGAKVVAFFGEASRNGRWIVEADTMAAAVFGQVTLDLREAVLSQREVVITANAVFGQVTIMVPHGVIVRDEGTAIFGSRSGSKIKNAGNFPVTPETPVIIVRGVALFGEVSAVYPKLPRDGFFGRRG